MRHLGVGVLLFVCSCTSSDIVARAAAVTDGGVDTNPTRDAGSDEPQVNPEYDTTGALLRPTGWEQWVFLGSALNLNYGSSAPPPSDILSFVYMEPTAYRYFKAKGEFREGTMTALPSYQAGSAGPPALGGTVPIGPSGFEMSVKDRERTPEGWGYYHFDAGPNATGDSARAIPRSDCFDCHDQHAETDHVFTQYYPMLP